MYIWLMRFILVGVSTRFQCIFFKLKITVHLIWNNFFRIKTEILIIILSLGLPPYYIVMSVPVLTSTVEKTKI